MSEVVLIEKSVKVPKELNDISMFLGELLKDIIAKKEVTAILAENLPNLMQAVQGFEALPAEMKSKEVYAAVGLLVADIGEALLYKPEVAEVPVA